MSISITISNINDLTDTERAVLRLVADGVTLSSEEYLTIPGFLRKTEEPDTFVATDKLRDFAPVAPVEPEEAHVQVIPTPPAPAPSGSAELDAAGLPWDKRIHASTRSKVAAGTWKYARGVDGDYIKTVERELRGVQDIPVPDAPIHIGIDVAEGTDVTAHTPVLYPVAAAVTPTPIVPPAPPAPAAALPMSFAQLMQHITPMLVSGKLTQPMLQGVVATLDLPHLAALGARPDLVETVRAAIDAEVSRVTV